MLTLQVTSTKQTFFFTAVKIFKWRCVYGANLVDYKNIENVSHYCNVVRGQFEF